MYRSVQGPLSPPTEASLVCPSPSPEWGVLFLFLNHPEILSRCTPVTSGVKAALPWSLGSGGSSKTQGSPESPLIHTVARGDYQVSPLECRTIHVPNSPHGYMTLEAVGPAVINKDQLTWWVSWDVDTLCPLSGLLHRAGRAWLSTFCFHSHQQPGTATQGQEGLKGMLKSWRPSCPRQKSLVPTHPGDRLYCFSGVGIGTFTQRISLPQREVNLLKATKVTLCHLSLRLEEKKTFNFDSDTCHTRWKLSWAKELHL